MFLPLISVEVRYSATVASQTLNDECQMSARADMRARMAAGRARSNRRIQSVPETGLSNGECAV